MNKLILKGTQIAWRNSNVVKDRLTLQLGLRHLILAFEKHYNFAPVAIKLKGIASFIPL